VDRLIALVALRWRLAARLAFASRARLLGSLLAVPLLVLVSVTFASAAFFVVRLLESQKPEALVSVLSAAASVAGLLWALSPLLAGVSATETHDLGKLLHYPVPLGSLVASSLLANLLQPTVLVPLPALVATALALAGSGPGWPAALLGLLLTLALFVAVGQVIGLFLHALSRHRKWHDRMLFLGIGLGMALSFLPLLLMGRGASWSRGWLGAVLARDVFALVPFSWGARAAVYAGRGEPLAFLAWAGAAAMAVAAAAAVSIAIAQRLYRGELDLGEVKTTGHARARAPLPGLVGALVEKDLRVAWRDPRLKALLFSGVLAPLLLLVVFQHGLAPTARPGMILAFASFAGLGTLGANALALERQGLALLFSTPAPRLLILVGKNLGVLLMRTPALVAVSLASAFVVGLAFVPATVAIVLLTQVLGASADNYLSILAPVPVAAAGRDQSASQSGMRGLSAAALLLGAMGATLALSAPFAFLAWLPYLLGVLSLWLVTLPLALLGAGGVYFMLTAGAAHLLQRREPLLLARAFGEE
jgi:ABC-2 type transport system permease protein